MDDVLREFLVESIEGLDQLDRNLVALEQRPGDGELLASIFRCVHTIKGTCGFLGFPILESVAHAGESLLALLRDGTVSLTPAITNGLLQLVDAIRSILGRIESTGKEGAIAYTDLIALLSRLHSGEAASETVAGVAEPADGRMALADTTVRVDVTLLDRLMNLVGELVLARNQVLQYTARTSDATFLPTSQRLNLITSELQEGVMKTRMQPIGNVWGKFPRVVRDLAVVCGKQVALEMTGEDTELDRTIIEAVKDPLTHIVRNSIDHGIELPADRVAAGKPAEGRITMRAYHEGGQVNIEIGDDGGGVDTNRVRKRAIERGLITPDHAAQMTEREALDIIFQPGFSTAAQVSTISGRGVGMDVVRTNIERIGGTVDVETVAGRGSTIHIKIPLTLAIVPALVVTCAGDRYAIPQVNLVELVRSARAVEMVHGAPVYRLRGRLLPLVWLNEALGDPIAARHAERQVETIVVLRAGESVFGVVVDEVNDTEEIVVKPLGKMLKGIPLFAGATIMGDGGVALILNVVGLAQQAHVVSGPRERARADAKGERLTTDPRQTLLILGLGTDRRLAVPLSAVARLEQLPRGTVERAGSAEVVQYRGNILTLLRLSTLLGVRSEEQLDQPLQVVVYAGHGRPFGLVVDGIVDIVEEVVTVHEHGRAVIQERVTELIDVERLVRAAEAA